MWNAGLECTIIIVILLFADLETFIAVFFVKLFSIKSQKYISLKYYQWNFRQYISILMIQGSTSTNY